MSLYHVDFWSSTGDKYGVKLVKNLCSNKLFYRRQHVWPQRGIGMQYLKYTRSKLLYKLYQKKAYWNIQRAFRTKTILFNRYHNKLVNNIRQEKQGNKAARDLLKESRSLVLSSLLVVIIVLFFEGVIHKYLNYKVADKLPGMLLWLRNMYILAFNKINSSTSYTDFMGVTASIISIFTGLYYASISSISGAIYSKTSQQIRDIFSHETVGYTYLRSNTLLAIICLCFFIAGTVGLGQSLIAIFIVGIWVSFSIVSFLLLGNRAFNFYDPKSLSGYVVLDIIHCINKCQVTSRCNNETSQNLNKTKVAALVELLEELSGIINNEIAMRRSSYAEIIYNACRLISWYQEMKRHIPYDSKWYSEKRIHRDWYQSETQRIFIAKQTATTIDPDVVKDHYWLEDRLEKIIIKGFNSLLEQKQYNLAVNILVKSDSYLVSLMKNALVDKAISFHERLFRDFLIFLKSHNVTEADAHVDLVGIMDYLMILKQRIVLESIQHCKDNTYDNYQAILRKIKWRHSSSIYCGVFSFRILRLVSWLSERLRYEIEVEGKIISPAWYQLELISLEESCYLSRIIKTIIIDEIARHHERVSELKLIKNPRLMACFVSEELEYWKKTENALAVLNASWDDINTRKNIHDLQWPHIDITQTQSAVTSIKESMMLEMAECLELRYSDSLPDYFGQFMHILADYLIYLIINNEAGQFLSIYKKFFASSFFKYAQLFDKLDSRSPHVTIQFSLITSPLLELLDISGYAVLFSELHADSTIWDEVLNVWNEYFDNDKNDVQDKLVFMLNLEEQPLYYNDRDMIRIEWMRLVNEKLSSLPKTASKQRGTGYLYSGTHQEIIHSSALVRACASSYDEFHEGYDGIDMFLNVYLEERFKGIIQKLKHGRNGSVTRLNNDLHGSNDADE